MFNIITQVPLDHILYRGELYKFAKNPLLGDTWRIYPDIKQIESGISNSHARVIKFYKEQASFFIPPLLKNIAVLCGYNVNKVSVRVADKRWGSCNSNKNISINSKLILAPTMVLKAVIMHELAHTVHLNHSKLFWNHLYDACPYWKESAEWLKKHYLLIQNIWYDKNYHTV